MIKVKYEKMAECQAYFETRPVFRKVFMKLCEKYESLSRMGGSIRLTGLTNEEKNQLSGFLQKDYIGKKTVVISWNEMEKVLENSRFAPVTLKDILEVYNGSLLGKRERKEKELAEREALFEYISEQSEAEEHKLWFRQQIEEKTGVYKILLQLSHDNKAGLAEMMRDIFKAMNRLPAKRKEVLSVPVFAADITGNPHYFDEGTVANQILYSYLKCCAGEAAEEELSATEQKNEILYQAGLVKDDMWNVCLAYGICGIKQDGTIHKGIEGFFTENEPVQVTLRTLWGLKCVKPECEDVYMVENPAVFSYLCKKYPDKSFICGNGQLNLAVWVVLKKLKLDGCIYYSGDFDPEGLLIAQSIKKRYPDSVKYWNYTAELYENNISDKEISQNRLKKLENIDDIELQDVKEKMLCIRRAAYQEAFLADFSL